MKPLVAAATLQLVEEGKIALDRPLPAVLPRRVLARFPDADRITVRMLLNHTSGIGEYSDARHEREVFADPRRRWTVQEFLDRAAAQPRSAAPGARTPTRTTPCSAWSSSRRPGSPGGRSSASGSSSGSTSGTPRCRSRATCRPDAASPTATSA
jgi:CubicO group peptidase (beta-lactamase class C family)